MGDNGGIGVRGVDNRGPGRRSESERILNVLEAIKAEGLKGVGNFILLALTSDDPRVKSHVAPIYQTKGKALAILGVLMKSCVLERRQTGKYVDTLKEKVGGGVRAIFQDVVDSELKDVMQDKGIHRPPSSLTTDSASDFSFGALQNVFEEKAPFTWGIICWLCGLDNPVMSLEDGDDDDAEGMAELEDKDGAEEGQEGEGEGEGEGGVDESEGAVGGRKRRARRAMDRYLRATTVLGVVMNSRNVQVNYFQTMVGMGLTGFGTPKRAINLMSRLGLTISYQTIVQTLKLTAVEGAREVKELAKLRPLGCAYDNLNVEQKAGTETMENRTSAYKLTVNLVWELVVPEMVATEGQLLRRMCIVEDVDYDELDPLVVMGFHSMGEFWGGQIGGLLCNVLWKWCGKEMDVNPIPGKRERIMRKSVHPLPLKRTIIRVGPTLEIDEGTVPGNIQVMEEMVSHMGLDFENLVDKLMVYVGDMSTVVMQRNAKEYRKRDLPHRRLDYVDPWHGLLHTQFVLSGAIAAIHKGHSSAQDIFSLERFKVLLGKTKLMAPKPPFHAQESFHEIVFESMVLSVCMEELKCKDLDALRERMKTCHFYELISKLAEEYFDLKRVAVDRDSGWGRDALAQRGTLLRGRRGGGRGQNQSQRGRGRGDRVLSRQDDLNAGAGAGGTRDLVRENAMLCMQHLAIARLFQEGIRRGDTGVVEGMLDILTLFFHGTNNTKYAAEFLLQNINRKVLWTPFYRQVWLDNSLVNISGRANCWLSLDEVCEITVDQLKNDYNLRGSWQSRSFHLNVVSPNIHLLQIIKDRVMKSSCASTGGLKKGIVSISKDVSVLCKVLVEDGVFILTPGRDGLDRLVEGGVVESRKYHEASDPLEIGIRSLRDKHIPTVLEKIRRKQSLFTGTNDTEDFEEIEMELGEITGGVFGGGAGILI